MKSWLADIDATPAHPDAGVLHLPLPSVMPAERDFRRSVQLLESRLAPTEYDHIVFCVAKLITGFNERLTKDEAKARARLWHEVLPDVPRDLWTLGTMELLQTWKRDNHYGRVPEAADLRAIIEDRLTKRRSDLRHCRRLLGMDSKAIGDKPKTFMAEPEDVLLRAAIARWHKNRESFLGPILRKSAIEAEIRLAEIESRAPEVWAIEQATKPPAPAVSRPAPRSPSPPIIEGEYEPVYEAEAM